MSEGWDKDGWSRAAWYKIAGLVWWFNLMRITRQSWPTQAKVTALSGITHTVKPIPSTSSCITATRCGRRGYTTTSWPLVGAEMEPESVSVQPLSSSDNSLCEVTDLYYTALSLCPAAGDGWDSFCPLLPPPRLHTVAAKCNKFIALHFALSITH